MKKIILSAMCLVLAFSAAMAQSKVFKEVSNEIASTMRTIRQDNALVGYLVFTRLEKANKDSFNYRISIMDENLNDIGKVEFKDEDLRLGPVAFDQDILCLAYAKNAKMPEPQLDNSTNTKKKKKKASTAPKLELQCLLQFVSLEGKIVSTTSFKTDVAEGLWYTKPESFLVNSMTLKNVPQKGFSFFYADKTYNYLQLYGPDGKKLWSKNFSQDDKGNYIITTAETIYLVVKKIRDGGELYSVNSYNTADGNTIESVTIKDKDDRPLRIVGLGNDPVTNKPYLSGLIMSKDGAYPGKVNNIGKNTFFGVFTVNINGPKKADIKQTFTYWDEGEIAAIKKTGYIYEAKGYPFIQEAFRDYQGNTYFAGMTLKRKVKTGAIISTILTAPFLMPPLFIAGGGYTKYKFTDAFIMKQLPDGKLATIQNISCKESKYRIGVLPVQTLYQDVRDINVVTNENTKNNFLVIDDNKNITIYNVTQNKMVRTIPHKEGGTLTSVGSAKEGHIMVVEYNKKEKYTRLSIEPL